ncbi:MAG: SRPBCC family protein [Magnetovibrio sp.]|nr:SRPBCC family protein [Magnetovibrio sp.]
MTNKRLISNTSTIIYQPLDQIWTTISDFHDLSWCPNVISKCVALGETPGNTPGAKRIVDDVFSERLRSYNSDVHLMRYVIEQGPPPLASVEDLSVHIEMQLKALTEHATEVIIFVNASATQGETVPFCMNICIQMIDDLRNTLQDQKQDQNQ